MTDKNKNMKSIEEKEDIAIAWLAGDVSGITLLLGLPLIVLASM